jgi:hypothetical protein
MFVSESHHQKAKNITDIPPFIHPEKRVDNIMAFGTFDIFHP